MLGNKDFPYPKPMSLIKSLVAQATEPDRATSCSISSQAPEPQGMQFWR